MSKKSNFRTTPDYGQMGYGAAYGYVSWNGMPGDGVDIAQIAAERAKAEHVPDGMPRDLFVSNFIRYIDEH